MRPDPSRKRLASYLREQSAGSENVSVEAPKRMRDRFTGRLRGHDVVLTILRANRMFLVAIDCHERSRPVGLSHLEAFANKCMATSIHKPVMVSSCGFTRNALLRAKTLGIHCLSLEQAERFPWFRCDTTPVPVRKCYTRIDLVIVPGDGFEQLPASYTLVNEDGETVSPGVLRDYLLTLLIQRQQDQCDDPPGDNVERIMWFPENLSVIDDATLRCAKVRHICLVAYGRSEEKGLPTEPDRHGDSMSALTFAGLSRLLVASHVRDLRLLKNRGMN